MSGLNDLDPNRNVHENVLTESAQNFFLEFEYSMFDGFKYRN